MSSNPPILEHLDLFDGLGKSRTQGSNELRVKVELFQSADRWGEFEEPKTIRIHEELSKRDSLIILFHEAGHALWQREGLGKKADEETVCARIAEGLARMVLGNPLEAWVAGAKAESWEIPRHLMESPREALPFDCESIERTVASNRCVRRAPIDYQPWDMLQQGKARCRYLCRCGVKAVRRARERVKQALETEPPHLWETHLTLLELTEYSLRVRLYWRHGHREAFKPEEGAAAERLERERTWYSRTMGEWQRWREKGPVPSDEAMHAAMHALSHYRP